MAPASISTSRASRALETGEAKLWVLLVGVNQYQDEQFPNLSYSALDCQGLGEAIAAATQAFPQKSVMVHHDFANQDARFDFAAQYRPLQTQIALTGRLSLETHTKLRYFPTQTADLESVRASLARIASESKPEDTVLFYFSGHGLLEANSQQAVLCLADTSKDDLLKTGLSMLELIQRLGSCAAHQQLVWLDACHSGGMTLRVGKGEPAIEPMANPTLQLVEVLRQRAKQSKGFYALLSCDQNQQSWEFPELGHGVFTYYLMRGLLGEAADGQGVIEADALYKYVYYQTLRYIDQTNQQLRLINQQKRGRGETQLQAEYSLQTPKRIVEGVGELILGLKPEVVTPFHPRQALVVEGIASNPATLALSKVLRQAGDFELSYFPQPGKGWADVPNLIQRCLQSGEQPFSQDPPPLASANQNRVVNPATVLLYLRGRVEQTRAGDAQLILRDQVQISRSWLRQVLRRSSLTQQVVILDCPGASDLADWVEDLQIGLEHGQCLIAAAASEDEPEEFANALLQTLAAVDSQAGLPIAGWIAQLQRQLAGTGIRLHTWLSGTQGVIEVLPGEVGSRRQETSPEFDLGLCPYLGLQAFSEDDSGLFFGRENLTQQLINQLSRQSFLAVVGASGSGKSSVVQAGLMAQLRQGRQIPGSERWRLWALRPGARPLDTLAQRLVDSGTEKEQHYQQLQLEGILYQGVEGFVHWLRSRPEPMVVLVIDQFEELFTLSPAEDRDRFLDLLLGAIAHAGDRVKLVITLRTDFIAPCLEYPALARALQRSSVLAPPVLSEEDYRQVIIKPAEKVGLRVEPELVEVLLQALNHGLGDLPLLEFVLEQIWRHRQPGELTLQVYQQQVGGLKGALERKAQSVYDSLDADAQACARWIFLSLTQLGEGTEDTRRRVSKSELIVAKYPAPLVERTLQALVAAKLVVVSLGEGKGLGVEQGTEDREQGTGRGERRRGKEEDRRQETEDRGQELEGSGDGSSLKPQDANLSPIPAEDSEDLLQGVKQDVTIEVAHEILIRHWSTLRWWLEENRARLRSQRQIEQAALQWKQHGERSEYLLQGVRLDAAEELYIKYTDELPQDVQRFVEAGLEARIREQQTSQRRLRRAQVALALISALGVTAASFGALAYRQRQQAFISQIAALNALSESQLLAYQSLESLITSVKAAQQLRSLSRFGVGAQQRANIWSQTLGTLQQAVKRTQEHNRLEGHSQWVNCARYGADGQRIASASDDGAIRIWRADGELLQVLEGPGDRMIDAAFSPDGQILAAASANGDVYLWRLLQGTLQRTVLAHDDWVTSVAFSPDGRLLATGSRDQTIKLWQVSDGTLLNTLEGHQGWVNSVHFSSDGQFLASGSEDNTIKLWQVTTGNLSQTLTGHAGRVTRVAFAPDGAWLASASGDQTVRIWNLTEGKSQILEGHQKQGNDVDWSPKGNLLVSTGADRTLKIWRAANGDLLKTLRGHSSEVLSAHFKPGSQLESTGLYSPEDSTTYRIWTIQLISAAADNTVRLWNTQVVDDPNLGMGFSSRDLSPDGQLSAIGGWEGGVYVKSAAASGGLWQELQGHDSVVLAVRFSANGQRLASGGEDRTIRLWNPHNQTLLQILTGHEDRVTSLSFSPNAPILASGSDDKTVRLWNTDDGSLLKTLTGHEDGATSVAFSADGEILASGSHDNTIKLWRSDGTVQQTLASHELAIAALAFSPDGETLASASWDHTIKLWQVKDGALLQTLTGHQAGVTRIRFSADGRTLISDSADRTTKLWNPNDGALVKTLFRETAAISDVIIHSDQMGLAIPDAWLGDSRRSEMLDQFLEQGCDRLRDYLATNPNVGEGDLVCRGIL